jgi:transposase
LKRQNAQRLEQIDRQTTTVEAAILQIVEADKSLADRFAIRISIPGVSNITAFALLIAMPELGSLEAGQAANLAGLAPIARQSGRSTGRGGRADVRQALYMPALVAARFNPDMKAKIRTPHRNRKTRKSRPDRDHANARRLRKCPPKGKSNLDAKNRLINTDTLALALQKRIGDRRPFFVE